MTRKELRGDDVRVVSDKSLSSFTVAFSISGSLRRSFEHIEREREKRRRFKEELMQAAFAKGKRIKEGITPNKNTRTRVMPDTCGELEIIRYPLTD